MSDDGSRDELRASELLERYVTELLENRAPEIPPELDRNELMAYMMAAELSGELNLAGQPSPDVIARVQTRLSHALAHPEWIRGGSNSGRASSQQTPRLGGCGGGGRGSGWRSPRSVNPGTTPAATESCWSQRTVVRHCGGRRVAPRVGAAVQCGRCRRVPHQGRCLSLCSLSHLHAHGVSHQLA